MCGSIYLNTYSLFSWMVVRAHSQTPTFFYTLGVSKKV